MVCAILPTCIQKIGFHLRGSVGRVSVDLRPTTGTAERPDPFGARHFYGVDSSEARHYDLVLDTVRIGWDLAEQLIVHAARGGY